MVSGSVRTSGTPTKKVPENSSSEIRNTKIALAISPGAAKGSDTVMNARSGEAPRLRAASTCSSPMAANDAEAIHTANTRPWMACTSITPQMVPVSPKP